MGLKRNLGTQKAGPLCPVAPGKVGPLPPSLNTACPEHLVEHDKCNYSIVHMSAIVCIRSNPLCS